MVKLEWKVQIKRGHGLKSKHAATFAIGLIAKLGAIVGGCALKQKDLCRNDMEVPYKTSTCHRLCFE